jgi:Holliday junction DNA helicase RuvA
MIAMLSGVVAALGKDYLVIQVGGVGFQVFVPRTLLEGIDGPGQDLTLFTHLQVRENELALYGFSSEEDLSLFRLLQTVTGVGPKVALSLLSALPVDRLRSAIAQGDEAALARVPGVGPKTARKLAFDLRDKVSAEQSAPGPWPSLTQADADLISALTTLGYSVHEAQEAARTLPREPLPLEERVRLALRHFAS